MDLKRPGVAAALVIRKIGACPQPVLLSGSLFEIEIIS
jgi:hypothetical protein